MTIESHPSFATVKDDAVQGLQPGFTPRDGDADKWFRVSEHFVEAEVIGNDEVTTVPWTYQAVHTGDFQCLFRTGRLVIIRGVTVVDNRGDPVLHRYVDWLGLCTQLGLEVSWRPAVTEAEYAYGRD